MTILVSKSLKPQNFEISDILGHSLYVNVNNIYFKLSSDVSVFFGVFADVTNCFLFPNHASGLHFRQSYYHDKQDHVSYDGTPLTVIKYNVAGVFITV